MRVICAALLVSMMAQASAASAEGVHYLKRRNLFASLDVPSNARRSEADTYVAHRRGAVITITIDASTPHVDEREAECQGGRLTYKLDRPKLFAFSCRARGQILYSITKYGETYRVGASDATEEIGFTIRYPVSQRGYWDPVVAHMSRSLRFIK